MKSTFSLWMLMLPECFLSISFFSLLSRRRHSSVTHGIYDRHLVCAVVTRGCIRGGCSFFLFPRPIPYIDRARGFFLPRSCIKQDSELQLCVAVSLNLTYGSRSGSGTTTSFALLHLWLFQTASEERSGKNRKFPFTFLDPFQPAPRVKKKKGS